MVWFGQLDMPEEIVEAHRNGDLVIFVGAGASVAPPSGMPTFAGLTAQIEASIGVPRAVGEAFDVYLGRIDGLTDIHTRVAEIIGASTSSPNAMHRSLAELGKTSGACRIVTTNYDRHLSEALDEIARTVEEWSAPALPVGSDFEGLVYLHGTLSKPPSRLVVTDEDFGRAYLRDAWATRFLDEMFRQYKILFVGYSHEDLIMTYLGRGLRADSQRWILTDNPSSDLYKRLKISPVPFDHGAFADLEHAVDRWAADAAMGLLDHRVRLAQLLKFMPSELTLEEVSYLEATLTDAIRTRIFTEIAKDIDDADAANSWLAWVASRPEFQALLDERTTISESSERLSDWFAECYVVRAEHSEAALQIARTRKGKIHSALWSSVALAFFRMDEPRAAWANPWVLLLLRDAPTHTPNSLLEYLLGKSSYPDDHAVIVGLLDHLLLPKPDFQTSFFADGTRVGVTFLHDTYEIDQAIGMVVAPNISQLAPDLLALVEHHLTLAHDILDAGGAISERFDPLSFGRSAIEPHAQDSHRDPVDPLIDRARDTVKALLRTCPALAAAVIERWIQSHVQLLRRVAVHTVAERSDMRPDEKLAWLTGNQLLWDFQCQHEVFRLIAQELPSASKSKVDQLINLVQQGPDIDPGDTRDDAEEHRQYRIYNAVVWMNQNAPQVPAVSEAMKKQQSTHPQWGPRDDPDLQYSLTVGFDEPQPLLIDVSSLHDLIVRDPPQAIRTLLELDERVEGVRSSWSRPSADALAADVVEHPLDGLAILAADSTDANNFRETVISAWRQSQVTEGQVKLIAAALNALDLLPIATDVANLLAHASAGAKPAWCAAAEARALARRTWSVLDPAGETTLLGSNDILTKAYNSAAGHLAQYWLEVFFQEWRETEGTWTGIPESIRSDLETSIGSGEATGSQSLARAVYLSRLHLFWNADREWTATWLYPLLDWAKSHQTADLLWPAYLMGGRWNDQMLAAGLLQQYLRAARQLTREDDQVSRQFAGHLAAISIQSTLDLRAVNWLNRLTIDCDDELRVEWLDSVGYLLREGVGEPEAQWKRWIAAYLDARIRGIPVALTEQEASAAAEIVVQLDTSFRDAVTLIEQTEANLDHDRSLVHRLEIDKVQSYPEATAHLVVHMLRGTTPGEFYDYPGLKRIFAAVKDHVSVGVLNRFKERTAALGFTEALTW